MVKSIRKISILLFFLLSLIFITNCGLNNGAYHGFGPLGGIFSSYTTGLSGSIVGDTNGSKTAEACTQEFIWLFSTGKGSVADAARRGRINTIYVVNRKVMLVLGGIYASVCTEVTGVEGGAPAPTQAGGGGSVRGFGDSVILKNGKTMRGVKVAVTGDSVVVTTTDGQTMVYSKSEVRSVKKGR